MQPTDTDAAPGSPAPTGPPLHALTVYFDGSCPVCTREIAAYRRMQGANACAWVDVSACEPQDLGRDLDRASALARMTVRRHDGTLVGGARAFIEIWLALPKLRWLGQFGRFPGVSHLLNVAYRAFLAIRPLWRHGRSA
jgi:predicted DCC family thiol-disulfide oxidoreductase YuxK